MTANAPAPSFEKRLYARISGTFTAQSSVWLVTLLTEPSSKLYEENAEQFDKFNGSLSFRRPRIQLKSERKRKEEMIEERYVVENQAP